jgi:hypothetical protein
MDSIKWRSLFTKSQRVAGAGQALIRLFLRRIKRPLSKKEYAYLEPRLRSNPYPESDPLHATYNPPDARELPWPQRRPPESYLDFLCWSDGGTFVNGKRTLKMIPCLGIRDEMLVYFFPYVVPLILPFATVETYWYGFDLSNDPVEGEYPVVFSHYGDGMSEPIVLASSFLECCRDQRDPIALYRKR